MAITILIGNTPILFNTINNRIACYKNYASWNMPNKLPLSEYIKQDAQRYRIKYEAYVEYLKQHGIEAV